MPKKKALPTAVAEEVSDVSSLLGDEGMLEESEGGAISLFPVRVGNAPCVLMIFNEPVEHLVFDAEELEMTFEAALAVLSAAEDNDINNA